MEKSIGWWRRCCSETCCRNRCNPPPREPPLLRQPTLSKTASLILLDLFLATPTASGLACFGERRGTRGASVLWGCDAEIALRVDRLAVTQNLRRPFRTPASGRTPYWNSRPRKSGLTQPYMITIAAGIRSMFIAGRVGRAAACQTEVPEDGSVTFGCAEGLDRQADQFTDADLALCIGHYQGSCSAVTGQRLFLPAQFCVKIAAGQLEERIRRIFFRQRTDHTQGSFILQVVAMQIQGEVKASHIGRQNSIRYGVLEQAHALLLGASRDSHEEAQDSGHGAECVHVIVVEAEAHVSIGEAGIQSFGADKMIAGAYSSTGGVAILAAKSIEPRRRGVGHSRVELHFRGFMLFALRVGQGGGLGGQLKIMLIGAVFGAAARVRHSIFVFRRSAPNAPPQRLGFEKISQRMIGAILFHALGGFHGSRDVEGIDFVEDGGRLGWQSEFGEARRRGKGGSEQKGNERRVTECQC